MKKYLSVEDFRVLRKPLESGRQSPNSLAGALLLGSALQFLVWFLTYNVAGKYTNYPNSDEIRNVHFIITMVLIGCSILFSFPFVYKKAEKIQYLVSIITTQNFGVSFFLIALFLIGENEGITENMLISFTNIAMFFGILLLVCIFVRYSILINRGHYKTGSSSDIRREKIEKRLHLPTIIVGSTALVFIIQHVVRVLGLASIETIAMVAIFISISYTIIYVLPEQLIILYCKYRFKSFNYNERGYLYSETEEKER
ncbi:ABC transporter ATPase [Metabacillus sp. KIGAM252]|uniref:ABC transporter ATPase n=1 Tax=Metabacillus flavus TaxID=2823519 RepID=A0ABS5LA56_9BACI|nr:ABC transporter ATPase [Metabacillus flavus]MBS2967607.1 ABC transporter ATPase [Metabacillus flavus]